MKADNVIINEKADEVKTEPRSGSVPQVCNTLNVDFGNLSPDQVKELVEKVKKQDDELQVLNQQILEYKNELQAGFERMTTAFRGDHYTNSLVSISDKTYTVTIVEASFLDEMKNKFSFSDINLADTITVKKKLLDLHERLTYYDAVIKVNDRIKLLKKCLFNKTQLMYAVAAEDWRLMLEEVCVLLGVEKGKLDISKLQRLLDVTPKEKTPLRLALVEVLGLLRECKKEFSTSIPVAMIVNKITNWMSPLMPMPSWLVHGASVQELEDGLVSWLPTMSMALMPRNTKVKSEEKDKKEAKPKKSDEKDKEKKDIKPKTEKNNDKEETGSGNRPRLCWKCREEGHIAANCPKKEVVGRVNEVTLTTQRPSESVTGEPLRVYIDTMADRNVFAGKALNNAQFMSTTVPITVPFENKVYNIQQASLEFVNADGDKCKVPGLVDRSKGALTLLNPDEITGTKVKVQGKEFELKIEGKRRYIEVFSVAQSDNRTTAMKEKFATLYGWPTPSDDEKFEAQILKAHQLHGCAKEKVLVNTFRAKGVSVPLRLLHNALLKCDLCRLECVHKAQLIPVVGCVQEGTTNKVLYADTAFYPLSEMKNKFLAVATVKPDNIIFLKEYNEKAEVKNFLEGICFQDENIKRIEADQAGENQISGDLLVRQRKVPIGLKNANGIAEGLISKIRRLIRISLERLKRLYYPTIAHDSHWDLVVEAVQSIVNSRATSLQAVIPLMTANGYDPDFRYLPFQLIETKVKDEWEKGIIMAQYPGGDLSIVLFSGKKIIRHIKTVRIVFDKINAITTSRAKPISNKDPRVVAKVNEAIDELFAFGCFSDEKPNSNSTILNLIVIPTLVEDKVKVRIGIRGDFDQREVDGTVELPSTIERLTALILLLNNKVTTVDVRKAYYQTPYNDDVFIKIPKKGVFKLKKVIPGLVEGAKLWIQFFERIMEKMKFSKITSGTYKRDNELVHHYMDDIQVGSQHPGQIITELKQHLLLDDPVDGFPSKFVGWSMSVTEDSAFIGMSNFLSSIEILKTNGDFELLKERIYNCKEKKESESEIDIKKLKEAQSVVGKLAWIANLLPHVKIVQQTLASYCRDEPEWVIATGNDFLNQLRKENFNLRYKKLDDNIELRIFCDASFYKLRNAGVLGVVMQLANADWDVKRDENIIFSKCLRVKKRFNSTFSAEMEAMLVAIAFYKVHVTLLEKLLNKSLKVKMYTDSKSVLASVQSGMTNDAFSVGTLDFVLQELKKVDITVMWIPTVDQKADSLTKYMKNPVMYHKLAVDSN